jgi:hypothetical protein
MSLMLPNTTCLWKSLGVVVVMVVWVLLKNNVHLTVDLFGGALASAIGMNLV